MLTKTNQELFYNDEQQLLDFFINASFEKIQGSDYSSSKALDTLELIITPECNQQCDYCYIHNYGHLTYPKEIRASKEVTLNNIKILLDYLMVEKKYYFPQVELFAGDLFSTGYFFDLMDLLYPYYEAIIKNEPNLYRKVSSPAIVFPTNLQYAISHHLEDKLLDVSERFKAIDVIIAFSWSHDGFYAQDVREKKTLDEDYYDRAFKFMRKVEGGIHPMISTQNVANACKNFDWWVEKFEEYFADDPKFRNMYYPGDLEVRNDGWDDTTIAQFKEYLQYKFNFVYQKKCNGDLTTFVNYIFGKPQEDPNFTFKKRQNEFYDFFFDDGHRGRSGVASCSLQTMYTIRCSDLAIVPCHRTCYYQFIGGWYELNDDKTAIIGVKPNNVGQYIDLLSHRTDLAPRCVYCWNNSFCLKGCLGSQFESSGELYLPIDSVCRLEKARTACAIELLIDSGVLQKANELGYLSEATINRLTKVCEKLGYDMSWKMKS